MPRSRRTGVAACPARESSTRSRSSAAPIGGRYLTLRYRRRDDGGEARVGYAVPRRVGGAVDRNCVKRRLSEAIAREEALAARRHGLRADRPPRARGDGRRAGLRLAVRPGGGAAALRRGGRVISRALILLLRACAARAHAVRLDDVDHAAGVQVRANLLALRRAGDPRTRPREGPWPGSVAACCAATRGRGAASTR